MRVFVMYFIFFPCCILCRNAIQYFVSQRNVKEIVVLELENKDNSSKRWIEYKYVFDNSKDNLNLVNGSLRIGVFSNSWMKVGQIDCRISENESNVTFVEGYNIEVIQDLQQILNISTEITSIDDLTPLKENEIDIVICQPHFESLSSDLIELHPIIRSNLVLVFKPKQIHFAKDIFIVTFAGSLWVVSFAILCLLALCLRLSTQRYSRIKPKYKSWTWVEITLWAIAAACQQGLSHTPSGFASCTIFFLGYLMAYLLYTGFTAAITSILVENVGTEASLKSVRTETLHLVSPECTRSYIKQIQGKFLVTEYVKDLKELFEHLNESNKIGVGPEITVQQYIANNFDSNQLADLQIMKLNITFNTGFLTTQNNPWRNIINKRIVVLEESGILQNKLKRNLKPFSTFNLHSGYPSAGQEHVGSANILFLGGAVIALVFFVAELLLFLYKTGQKNKNNKN